MACPGRLTSSASLPGASPVTCGLVARRNRARDTASQLDSILPSVVALAASRFPVARSTAAVPSLRSVTALHSLRPAFPGASQR
ncbi:MAG TPA: hypothetical protein VGG85_10905 [Terracidiphilus sp.]